MKGFKVIRSLPIETYTRKFQVSIVFMLIGACIGNLRMQNSAGHILGNIFNRYCIIGIDKRASDDYYLYQDM